MRESMIAGLIAGCVAMGAVSAAETAATEPVERFPDVEAAIPAAVKALGKPTMMDFPGGIQMAVNAATDEVQARVNQGLNHLHCGWEFEASRHFAAALREDPECLLAHWGMVMSLLNPSPETHDARQAATDRLLKLVDDGKGSELERGYAYGLIKYIEEGPTGAAIAFRKIADNFPNDLQAAVFAALFSRGGYDIAGDATPDQEASEKSLLELIKKHPQSFIPINALLTIRAEGPDLTKSLDQARQLTQTIPGYPPFFHLLGHYEWRCGNHGRAASAFGRATSFYQRWMKDNNATVADCPDWVKAECYRVVALVSKGDAETAYAAARQVAATTIPANRPASPGTRILLWEATTLPARILIHSGLRGNAAQAALSLPKPDDLLQFRKQSLACWWIDGLRFALEARRLIDTGNFEEARNVTNALSQHGEAMAAIQPAAIKGGERSAWLRAFRALEVLASDVRGSLAMAGPKEKRGTAYNWYASAADRQQPSSMFYPPMILTPMASRLGSFFLTTGKPADAIEAFQRALATCPNEIHSLQGLKTAFETTGNPTAATQIGEKIKTLQSE